MDEFIRILKLINIFNTFNSILGAKVKTPWYDDWKIMECNICKTLRVNTRVMPNWHIGCRRCGEADWTYVSNERRFEMKEYER